MEHILLKDLNWQSIFKSSLTEEEVLNGPNGLSVDRVPFEGPLQREKLLKTFSRENLPKFFFCRYVKCYRTKYFHGPQ